MQRSFSDLEYAAVKRVTRRERFLSEIDVAMPWAELLSTLQPHYPQTGKVGRQPIGLERMLRMYLAQQCFSLSDEGAEDALYDSAAIRKFVGIDIGTETAPDATTLLKFRRFLEQHHLTEQLFAVINRHLAKQGLILKEGTIVDATLIAAPSSTKNSQGERDPEMHQAKKGNNYYFGMKAHIGVDSQSGLVHTLVTTPANVNDVTQAHALLHGEETAAYGDAGYQGVEKREENQNTSVAWHTAMRPGKRKQLDTRTRIGKLQEKLEHLKASLRAKVEHPFHILKNLLGHRKARYRGLAKNTAQLYTLFGIANLMLARCRLRGESPS
jgi:IS5 family transposase